jgi:hypothetical protein
VGPVNNLCWRGINIRQYQIHSGRSWQEGGGTRSNVLQDREEKCHELRLQSFSVSDTSCAELSRSYHELVVSTEAGSVLMIRVSQPSSTLHAIFVLRQHHWLRGNTVLLISNLPSHEASQVLWSYHPGMGLSVAAHACHLIR